MDKEENIYWIIKSREYALKHPSIIDVSDLIKNDNGTVSFISRFNVSLPGKYGKLGWTPNGIKKIEPVEFIFDSNYPYIAPTICLREDFNRNFPHINPSQSRVNPCIFDGKLNELLQQPMWFDLILNQMVDWFEKIASNSLMNLKQGWEPMRTDNLDGYIWFSKKILLKSLQHTPLYIKVKYVIIDNNNLFGALGTNEKLKKGEVTYLFLYHSEFVNNNYQFNFIKTFSDLVQYAHSCQIENFKPFIDNKIDDLIKRNIEHFVIIFALKRPATLIHDNSDIELINFVVNIKQQKKNEKIHMKSDVQNIGHREICTSNLLKQYSGNSSMGNKTIVQIGCGSVGSKICMSLAKNGNENFILIDNSNFSPHNNARHACIGAGMASFLSKAEILKHYINFMNLNAEAKFENIIDNPKLLELGNILIDSTASLSVRNYISKYEKRVSPVVNTSLYNHGKLAVLISEGNDKNPRIDDLFCSIYSHCLTNQNLKEKFLTEQSVRLSIGQGCGSFTTIASDARISLSTSGMASRIQYYLSNNVPKNGEILVGEIDDSDMNITWNSIETGKSYVIPKKDDEDWEIRILSGAYNKMNVISNQDKSKETGGGLVGHISFINQTITVTDLLPPPPDSIMTEILFVQGIEGLQDSIKSIQNKSNGLLTYLGTWHSHPRGGLASNRDELTKKRLIILRDYNPTVCLIWTPDQIIRV